MALQFGNAGQGLANTLLYTFPLLILTLKFKADALYPDTTTPILVSAVIGTGGATLTLTFSEPVAGVSLADFTFAGGGTLSSLSGTSPTTTYAATISPVVNPGETRTLSYVGTGTQDVAGNKLATFSNQAVTNNSTAGVLALLGAGFW